MNIMAFSRAKHGGGEIVTTVYYIYNIFNLPLNNNFR